MLQLSFNWLQSFALPEGETHPPSPTLYLSDVAHLYRHAKVQAWHQAVKQRSLHRNTRNITEYSMAKRIALSKHGTDVKIAKTFRYESRIRFAFFDVAMQSKTSYVRKGLGDRESKCSGVSCYT